MAIGSVSSTVHHESRGLYVEARSSASEGFATHDSLRSRPRTSLIAPSRFTGGQVGGHCTAAIALSVRNF